MSAPADVYVGGVLATVNYHGRSQFAGLDQINVVVPAGVSGCYVSVVVVTGSYVSNFGTLPVAAKGSRTCSDTSNPLTSSILNEIAQKGTFSIGVVSLTKTTTPGIMGIGGGTTDMGSADFVKFTSAQFNAGAFASAAKTASMGSCVVSTYSAKSTGATPPQPFKLTS